MEKSELYNLMEHKVLPKWREEFEKLELERESLDFEKEKELLRQLEVELSEKSRKLLSSYAIAIENRMDDLHYNLKIKVLNLGVKIGMELQKAFLE